MIQNPLTLTRQSLYDLVWSKPMSDLAKNFGMSDVGLAKRCRLVDVPIPYRGYWARVAAGQTPTKLPLPKYRTRTPPTAPDKLAAKQPPKEILRDGDEPVVRFGQPPERPAQPLSPEAATAEAFRQRIAGLNIQAAASVADSSAAVRRTAKFHKLTGVGALRLGLAERRGPLIDIDVTKGSLERALLLADRLIRTAEGLGWTLGTLQPPKPEPIHRNRWEPPVAPPEPRPSIAFLRVEGEPVPFRIQERLRVEARQPTPAELAREKREYGYHAPRSEWIPTGRLRVSRIDATLHWDTRRKTWYDHRNNRVEAKIPQILEGFAELAQSIKLKRAEDERRQRERAEEERRTRDRQERREAHAQLIDLLERQAGAWYRTQLLRRYIRAARCRLPDGQRIEATFRGQPIDFLQWATEYVEQLDPLSSQPTHPDQQPVARTYVSPNEDGFKRALYRVAGFDGIPTPKPFAERGHDTDSDEAL